MAGGNLLVNVQITRLKNAVAAGTTVQTGSTLDMQGWDGVMFVALFGTLTATQVTALKAQGGAAANGSDAADLAGTLTGPMADADSNKALVLDVCRPTQRYITPVINRATANAVIDGLIAIQYRGRKGPSAQAAAQVSASKTVVSPALGVA